MSASSFFITSSIGRKYVMGITGLFLVVFLLVHVGINALIFLDSSGALFNAGAQFMGGNWLIRSMEIVLFLGFLVHIVQSLLLTIANRKARPQGYCQENANANSKWYARSMGLLGTIILIFLIVHLGNFWVKARFHYPHAIPSIAGGEDMWLEMRAVFSSPGLVVLYLLAMVSLSYHLMHGFQSAFQSLGMNHKKYTPLIKTIGFAYAILVPLLFAAMPVYVYFFHNINR